MNGRALILAALVLMPRLSVAQVDIAGEWAVRLHEDQPNRNPGPSLGDYTGLPLNEAGRMRADAWDASLQNLKEHQTQELTVGFGFHGIANMRVSKIVDQATQAVVGYHMYRSPGIGATRVIWMDGRARPPAHAAHTWQGFSTGRWAGRTLVVETSHVKAGTLERNGVAHTDRVRITEYFMRHGNYLTIATVIDDPIYLEEPLVRTSNFVLNPDQELRPTPAQVAEEALFPRGYVPHHLPGRNPYLRSFAERFRLPYEATRGGRDTLYPEYAIKLKDLTTRVTRNDAAP